ncbi:MAG: YtxH domain-containing protein [Bernardetiaceae bacterium]|nr:YtxH domain-containing protein [Bernardetiaceae bacterium]
MRGSFSIMAALLGGALAGTFFGILFAPDKGQNTRDRLNYQLYKTRDRLKEIIDELVETKELPVSSAQEEGQRLISDVQSKTEHLLSDLEGMIAELQNKKKS